MASSNSAVFFVARTGSSRLPRKVLLPLADRPMIVHHFDRMKLAKLPTLLVLCTTTSSEDDELSALAESHGVKVYRGSETDVPGRLLNACREFDVDTFILCETDEHFSDPEHVDRLLRHVDENGGDWIHVEGNPIGAWLRAVSRFSMESLCGDMDTDNLSGWGSYFDQFPERFKLETLQFMSDEDAELGGRVRLTVDYPEDFEVAEVIYDRLFKPGEPIRIDQVVAELRRDPSLIEINRHRQDDYEANIKEQSKGIIS